MYKKLILFITILAFIFFESTKFEVNNLKDNKQITIEVVIEKQDSKLITLPLGSKFSDLIELLDISNDYNLSSYSLNEILHNNQIINLKLSKEDNLVSINSASLDELTSLPGIGKSIGKKIISYREMYGSFNSLEELKNVSGIGTKKYEKLKEYITL